MHAFAHSHHIIVPIPLWQRVPPGAQNELKEEKFQQYTDGGIYMASTVDEKYQMYNVTVDDPRAIGHLGDCEHLRDFCGEGRKLRAGEVCWFTDRTPYEVLKIPAEQFDKAGRSGQFFQLFTSEVSLWCREHSTKNPLAEMDGLGFRRSEFCPGEGRSPFSRAASFSTAGWMINKRDFFCLNPEGAMLRR